MNANLSSVCSSDQDLAALPGLLKTITFQCMAKSVVTPREKEPDTVPWSSSDSQRATNNGAESFTRAQSTESFFSPRKEAFSKEIDTFKSPGGTKDDRLILEYAYVHTYKYTHMHTYTYESFFVRA